MDNDATKCRKIIDAARREGQSNNGTIRFLKDILDNDESIPSSWKDLLKCAGVEDQFICVWLCPSCKHGYTNNKGVCGNTIRDGRRKRKCGADLSKSSCLPYRPISTWIVDMIRRYGKEEFVKLCNSWKDREHTPGVYKDWFDGEKFREYQEWMNDDSYDLSLCLMVNLDWWQPYKRTVYSLGGIYTSVLNLPREIRQKLENIFTLAIIPGPHEPHAGHEMNNVLQPLVEDLEALNKGMTICGLNIRVRGICWACDLPAMRKVLGMLSHNANKGCSFCHANLNTDILSSKLRVSQLRTGEESKRIAKRLRDIDAGTGPKKTADDLERDTGIRWSILNNLEYHDPVTGHVVEPMHNLLLGVADRVFKKLAEAEVLDCRRLAEKLGGLTGSGTIDRIGRGFSYMTANDWLELVQLAVYATQSLVSEEHHRMVSQLCEAIQLYTARTITDTEITRAEVMMRLALTTYVAWYEDCPPNFHMTAHLPDTIRRFGPAHVYWAFSFERKNGKEGRQQTNNKNISTQMMRKIDERSQCTEQADVPRSVSSVIGVPRKLNMKLVRPAELTEAVADDRVYYVQEVRGAVINRESVRKASAVQCGGMYGLVERLVLVNGKIVVLEMRELRERVVSRMSAAGPVFKQLAVVTRYVRCESVRLYRYKMEDNVHKLLPHRVKACT